VSLVLRVPRVLVMTVAAAGFAVPLLWLLVAPSKSPDDLRSRSPLAWGDVGGYARAWTNLNSYGDGIITTWILNSAYYTAAAVLIAVLTCLPAGYTLAMYDFRGRRAILNATLVMMLVPSAALVLPLFLQMVNLRLVNTAWSVILPLGLFPFGVYLSFLYYQSNLPRELVDAARVDGCTELRVFRSIGVPLGRPAIGVIGFFAFVQAWNNYFLPFVMFSDDRQYNLQLGLGALIGSTGAINPSRGATSVEIFAPEVALAALLAAAPILVIFMFAQRALVAGQVSGAVKG
jgi:multiple sugar transport system permease protein